MNLTPLTPTGGTIQLVNASGDDPAVVAPTLINPYSVMSIPAYKRAIAFLSENLACFPRSIVLNKEPLPEGTTHYLTPLIRLRPNGYQNAFVLWRTWFAHAAQRNNGYMRIERDAANFRPVALHNELPDDVLPFRYWPEGTDSPTQYYYVRSRREVLLGMDVLHLQSLGYDGMAGADDVQQHQGTFQLAHTLNKFQTKFLQKGTVIRGAIEVPDGMEDEEIDAMQNRLRRHFYGMEADRDVLILTHGGKLNNATVKPQEAEIIKQGAQVTKQISQITGVPPEFLMEFSESKYNNNLEQMGQNVVRYTFRPWITQAEAEMTMKLLSPAEQDSGFTVHLNPNELIRGDTKTQMEVITTGVKSAVYTKNEGRKILGLPRVADPAADKLQMAGDTTPQEKSTALST
jgi:HK97 family phage portal protein